MNLPKYIEMATNVICHFGCGIPLPRGVRSVNVTVSRGNIATPRRAVLFTPGDDSKKMNTALETEVDTIIFDLEDTVGFNRKGTARDSVKSIFDNPRPESSPHRSEWGIRVNCCRSGLLKDDIFAIFTGENDPSVITMPKVEHPQHIDEVSKLLSLSRKGLGDPVNLIICVESAKSLMAISRICERAFEVAKKGQIRPVALAFGCEDFCISIGKVINSFNSADDTSSGKSVCALRVDIDATEVIYARQKLLIIAKAYSLQAIDMLYYNLEDKEGLRQQSEQGAAMGFTGKEIAHPRQIEIVQNAFLPDDRKIIWATSLLRAYHQHSVAGQGSLIFQGSVVDDVILKQAILVKELAALKKDK